MRVWRARTWEREGDAPAGPIEVDGRRMSRRPTRLHRELEDGRRHRASGVAGGTRASTSSVSPRCGATN